jgi:two-component system, OmpR family, response regulator
MRVLIVQEDVRIAAAIRRALRAVNVIGDVASTSPAACAMLADTSYDVVVLDAENSDVDVFSICRRLRSAGDWTPILLVTAHAGDDRHRGRDAGVDDYLTKPFSFAELLARLRMMARSNSAERPAIIAVGSLRLDPSSAQVWRDDQEIQLSTREFALLEAFMRSPGQILGHSQLLDAAWDIGQEYRSNVIEVYMRYLREKIDRPFGVRSLETVRGLGYRLRCDGGIAVTAGGRKLSQYAWAGARIAKDGARRRTGGVRGSIQDPAEPAEVDGDRTLLGPARR